MVGCLELARSRACRETVSLEAEWLPWVRNVRWKGSVMTGDKETVGSRRFGVMIGLFGKSFQCIN